MQSEKFILLNLIDNEGHNIRVSLVGDSRFITVSGLELAIRPTDQSHFGNFFITISCMDSYNLPCTPIEILVQVPNNPPYFLNGLGPSDLEVPINKVTDVLFPLTRDPEGLIVSVNHTMLPDFTTFDEQLFSYHIEPINIQGIF